MSSPPPKSLVPASTAWPPSNPSGTVIPFPLPWGQTGCCPPGGMDALMKCYCDIQQASAFIGQIMLDQINNNPAIIAAIIAGIEASGSSLPTVGVTNGSDAQPGQVGEWVNFVQTIAFSGGNLNQTYSMGVLPPGDWDCWGHIYMPATSSAVAVALAPVPPGFSDNMGLFLSLTASSEVLSLPTETVRGSVSVPTLIAINVEVTGITTSGSGLLSFNARRRR